MITLRALGVVLAVWWSVGHAVAAGFTGHVAKPFGAGEVIRQVSSAIASV